MFLSWRAKENARTTLQQRSITIFILAAAERLGDGHPSHTEASFRVERVSV